MTSTVHSLPLAPVLFSRLTNMVGVTNMGSTNDTKNIFLKFWWLQTLYFQKIMKLLKKIPKIKQFQFIIITQNSGSECLFVVPLYSKLIETPLISTPMLFKVVGYFCVWYQIIFGTKISDIHNLFQLNKYSCI